MHFQPEQQVTEADYSTAACCAQKELTVLYVVKSDSADCGVFAIAI